MLNLAQLVRKDLRVVIHFGKLRLTNRDREHLIIRFPVVNHAEKPDRSSDHQASSKRRLGHKDQYVERIIVERERPRRKSIVSGIIHGRMKGTIKPENVQLLVVFVLIARSAGDFNNNIDEVWRALAKREAQPILACIESHAYAFTYEA